MPAPALEPPRDGRSGPAWHGRLPCSELAVRLGHPCAAAPLCAPPVLACAVTMPILTLYSFEAKASFTLNRSPGRTSLLMGSFRSTALPCSHNGRTRWGLRELGG